MASGAWPDQGDNSRVAAAAILTIGEDGTPNDIFNPPRTEAGISPRSSEADLLAAYPEATPSTDPRTEVHFYTVCLDGTPITFATD